MLIGVMRTAHLIVVTAGVVLIGWLSFQGNNFNRHDVKRTAIGVVPAMAGYLAALRILKDQDPKEPKA